VSPPLKTQSPALRLEGLTVEFPGSKFAVRDISFEVAPGRTLGIVGESGSGKSISLRAIMGILPQAAAITAGSLWMGDTELPLAGPRVRLTRRRRLAMVFQDPLAALNPVMRVGDLIAEVPRRALGQSKTQSRATALELMRQVHLPDPERLARAYPHQLSGGQRQRIMIAAALAVEPEVLLCDEPTTALDVTVQATVLELLAEIKQRTGLSAVFVSHDLAVISEVADDITVMRDGRQLESGTAADVLERPRAEYTRTLVSSVIQLPPDTEAGPGELDQAMESDQTGTERERASSSPVLVPAELAPTPRLAARGITVTYRRAARPALAGVDLTLAPREIHGLVGESGSGKTTLARVITGQLAADAGTVELDGTALGRRRSRDQLRAMQMIFQDPYASLDPRMTVRQTLTELLKLGGVGGKSALEARCRELLDQVRLPGAALDRVPGQFSGGQRQRIAIARALAVEPRVLVADEPTSSLDVSAQSAILRLLAGLRDEHGLSVLFISHNLGVVHEICEQISVLYQGEIVESGPTAAVFARPAHAYTRRLIESVPRLRTEAS
jgi:ABC-type glutathione transport system ATPase component